jgi:hypothetical protein
MIKYFFSNECKVFFYPKLTSFCFCSILCHVLYNVKFISNLQFECLKIFSSIMHITRENDSNLTFTIHLHGVVLFMVTIIFDPVECVGVLFLSDLGCWKWSHFERNWFGRSGSRRSQYEFKIGPSIWGTVFITNHFFINHKIEK